MRSRARGSLDGPVQEEETCQSSEIFRQKEETEEDEMK